MQVLRAIQQQFAEQVEIILFGAPENDPQFLALPRDFDYTNLGICLPEQLARLFNQTDIFVDFSNFQAMGLTAMEAMACGVAVIVPENGGSQSFAVHRNNTLVINTTSYYQCYAALSTLITDTQQRVSLMTQASQDIVHFYAEKSAYRILANLFKD